MSGSNPGGAGGLGGPSDLRKDSLTRLREQYAGEINTLISSLINNYLNIISGSAIDINDTVCYIGISWRHINLGLNFFPVVSQREVARLAARQSTIGIEIGTANLVCYFADFGIFVSCSDLNCDPSRSTGSSLFSSL